MARRMLHWVKSFLAMAMIAAVLMLAPPLRELGLAMTCMFAALALMALIAGAMGRSALGVIAAAAAIAWAAGTWIGSGWTAADAGRAIDRGVAQMAENVRR